MKSHPGLPAPLAKKQYKRVFLISCLLAALPLWAQTPRPVIRYANLLGGSAADSVTAVTADEAGSVYLAGTTSSPDFPATLMLGAAPAENVPAAFVAKVAPSGATLEYSVLLGPGAPAAIALGPDGSVFVAGALGLPTTVGAAFSSGAGALVKLDPSGSTVVYCTRLGSSSSLTVAPHGLAVDDAGNAFVTGVGIGVATTADAYKPSGFGAFVAKINADGTAMRYGTYLPSGDEYTSADPRAIAVDADGNAIVTGSANADGFPVTQDTLPRERVPEGYSTSDDVFLVKLSPDGAQLVFAELFGGYGSDRGSDVAVDRDGGIVVTGVAQRTTGLSARDPFPTTRGALDRREDGVRAFLTKVTPDGRSLVFSTVLPHSGEGACLNVTADGVDVMTAGQVENQHPDLYVRRLLRISADGSALLRTSIAAFAGAVCGHGGSRFALAQRDGPLTSPDLSPIGPGGHGDIWYTAVDADLPDAPNLEVNAGALELFSWFGLDGFTGNWPERLHIQTGDRTLPVSVRGGSYVKVEPEQGSTPLDIYPHPSAGNYTDRIFIFAPGAVDGLVVVPARQRLSEADFQLSPRTNVYTGSPGLVEMQADSADAPPVSGTLRVSSPAVSDLFGTFVEARIRFDLQPNGPLPTWLTMEGTPGTTPAEVHFTANPAGLADRLYSTSFQLTSKDRLPQPGSSFPTATAYLRVGPAPAALPVLVLSSQFVTVRSTDDQPAPTVTVHLDSSDGNPLGFTTDPIPEKWIQISPSSGTTPADVTIFIAPPREFSYPWHSAVQFRSSNRPIGFVDLTINVLLGDDVEALTVQPMSTLDASEVYPSTAVASGALFCAYLPGLTPGSIPETAEQADAWSLAFTLAGYSFRVEDQPVPARSYQGGRFVLQMPAGLAPGTHLLEAVDGSGAAVAESDVTVVATRPQILDQTVDYGNYARKEDGSAVTPENPAHPGDRILVRVTGQGATMPAIPDGAAASGEDPSKPLLPVTAYTGLKPLTVVSALMSTSEAGVLEVWVEVPELYDGDHYVSVEVGSLSAGVIPIKVAARPVE